VNVPLTNVATRICPEVVGQGGTCARENQPECARCQQRDSQSRHRPRTIPPTAFSTATPRGRPATPPLPLLRHRPRSISQLGVGGDPFGRRRQDRRALARLGQGPAPYRATLPAFWVSGQTPRTGLLGSPLVSQSATREQGKTLLTVKGLLSISASRVGPSPFAANRRPPAGVAGVCTLKRHPWARKGGDVSPVHRTPRVSSESIPKMEVSPHGQWCLRRGRLSTLPYLNAVRDSKEALSAAPA
jgi:hypothetical protein